MMAINPVSMVDQLLNSSYDGYYRLLMINDGLTMVVTQLLNDGY